MTQIAIAFQELAAEIFGSSTRLCWTVVKALRGPIGIWLANVATVLGLVFTVAPIQFFVQLPEVRLSLCEHSGQKLWSTLLSYSGKTIFLDLDFTRECSKLLIANPFATKIEVSKDKLFTNLLLFVYAIESVRSVADEPDTSVWLFYWEIQKDSGRFVYRIKSEPLYKIKIARDLPFDVPQVKNDQLKVRGAYVVKMDHRDAEINLILVPAPKVDDVQRQLSCREKKWAKWLKSVVCPFLPVRAPSEFEPMLPF